MKVDKGHLLLYFGNCDVYNALEGPRGTFKSDQHKNEAKSSVFLGKRRFTSTTIVNFDLPVSCIPIQRWKFSIISKKVDTLVHPCKRIRVPHDDCINNSIDDSEAQIPILLGGKVNQHCPFSSGCLDIVYFQPFVYFVFLKFACTRSSVVGSWMYTSNVWRCNIDSVSHCVNSIEVSFPDFLEFW